VSSVLGGCFVDALLFMVGWWLGCFGGLFDVVIYFSVILVFFMFNYAICIVLMRYAEKPIYV
jgi:hypothetical protein